MSDYFSSNHHGTQGTSRRSLSTDRSISPSRAPVLSSDEQIDILPSYEMYRSVVSPCTTPSANNFRVQPPTYVVSPQSSTTSSRSNSISEGTEQVSRFEDSLLPNIHKLRKLADENTKRGHAVVIKIKFTDKMVNAGEVYQEIPQPTNLKQGDCVHGVILFTNYNRDPVPFENFSVVLEGVVGLEGVPIRILNMVDLYASWNDAYLNRSQLDAGSPFYPPPGSHVDETDGTEVYLPSTKVLMPGITYKKFFTFKIPEKLIYCECDSWSVAHMQLPSSLGTSQLASGHPHRNDFSYPDASMTYGVHCSIVCKASDIGMKKKSQDEYILIAERYAFVNVFAGTYKPYELNRKMIDHEAMLIYHNLINEIETVLEENSIVKGNRNSNHEDVEYSISSTDSNQRPQLVSTPSTVEMAKLRQSYDNSRNIRKIETNYEVFMQYRKKSLFGSKVIGLAALSVSRDPVIAYITKSKSSCKIVIPMELNFIFSEGTAYEDAPNIKHITADMAIITTKAKKHPLQLLLTHDHIFQNKPHRDNMEYITIYKFQYFATELTKIMKKNGPEAIGPDGKRIVSQVKSLANLSKKQDTLHFEKIMVRENSRSESFNTFDRIPWVKEDLGVQKKFKKKFEVVLDLLDAKHTDFGKNFLLVPSFQNCYLGRMYYTDITFRCPNGDKLHIKIPLVLERKLEEEEEPPIY